MEQEKRKFFARKYGEGEHLLTIFKSPKIWGALLGEMLGTMLFTMLAMCTLGMFRTDYVPIFLMASLLGIYLATVKLSGAHLNPLITIGMLATRRMSAIRSMLYLPAQFIGAWVGFLILNALRLNGGYSADTPSLAAVTSDNFWALALIMLMSAIILAFCFARALRYARQNALVFAFTVASSIVLVYLLDIIIAQNFFGVAGNLVFNPASAIMYGVLPASAADFGELAQLTGLTLGVYLLAPLIGGLVGFYLSDIVTYLAGPGYGHETTETKT